MSETNTALAVVFSITIGIAGLIPGILMQLGIWKLWFLAERVPGIVVPSYAFGLIPMGMAFFLMGVAMMSVTSQSVMGAILCCVFSPLNMASIVLAVWQPWWIKPAWCRWLEEHHGDIIPILQEEGRAMGRWQWQRRVATQEGLEQWIAEVRQKRGLD
jgi:hypothetical protein